MTDDDGAGASGAAGPGGGAEPPAEAQPRGADLARQVLARAKQDARARSRGLPPGQGGAGQGGAGRRRRADGDPATDPESEADDDPTAGDRGTAGRQRRLPGIAAPGRRWREPVGFGTAISRLVAERGWKDQATDASVLARWDVIVGPELASHCTPVSLRDGVLELAAESTAWATQLRMLSRQLLATLRKELGAEVVQRIVVRGPTAPSWKHGPLRAPGGRGPRDTYG